MFHTRTKLPSSQLLSVKKVNKFSSNSGGPGYTKFLPRSQPDLAERSSFLEQPWGATHASDLQGDSFRHQNPLSIWLKTLPVFRHLFQSLAAIYSNAFLRKGLFPRQEPVARSSVVPAGHWMGVTTPTLILPLVPISLACCRGKCVKVCETLRCEGSCKRPDC